MASSLRVAFLAPILFALPAHAQSAAEFPVPAAATVEPAPPAPAPASSKVDPAAPAVNGTPSVDAASRRDPAVKAQQPLAQPAPAALPLPPPLREAPSASDAVGEHSEWYGWQTLTTDAVALTLLVLTAAAPSNNGQGAEELFGLASLGTYAFGGPIIHAVHGSWGRSAGSLGLRVGAPIVGILLGSTMEDCAGGSDLCGLAGGVVGATVGAVTAVAVDAAVLAHETVRDESPVMPVLKTGKNGTWLGIAGKF